jgi:micrococcal nuclease
MYEYSGTVIKVVDGDTIDVDIDLGFYTHKIQRVRLARINAPEMKTPGGPPAKNYLIDLIAGRPVKIQTAKEVSYDKYGRYIAEVWLGDANVSQKMLDSGNAVIYKG